MYREKPVLYVVVPCYNEEAVLPHTAKELLDRLAHMAQVGKITPDSRLLFVDDGSTDRSWEWISDLAREDPRVLGIRQSRNRGHQSSVLAGLMEAKNRADITITIDCDGQDDADAMEKMVDAWYEGCDIVYGVRSDRRADSFLKRTTAQSFYRLMRRMGVESVYNHADYRLLSRQVLEALAEFREVNLYLRGMIPLVGFKSTVVEYVRRERVAGRSHYSPARMLGLALDGITSLSIRPIRIITLLGILICLVSFVGVIWAVVTRFAGNAVAGWASTVAIVCFMGGIQMISVGVLGEYIGKIYMETKQRPRYIISRRTWEEEE